MISVGKNGAAENHIFAMKRDSMRLSDIQRGDGWWKSFVTDSEPALEHLYENTAFSPGVNGIERAMR